MKDRSRLLDVALVLLVLTVTQGRGPWLAHPVAAPRDSIERAAAQRDSSTAAKTVRNAEELTGALRAGGAIRLASGRYVGNFVVWLSTERRWSDEPTFQRCACSRRPSPAWYPRPGDPLMPTLQVTASNVKGHWSDRGQWRTGSRDGGGRVTHGHRAPCSNPTT